MRSWKRNTQTFESLKRMQKNSRLWLHFHGKVCCKPFIAWYRASMIVSFQHRRQERAMLLCKKIQLEISKQDAASLEFMQGKCRGLYNWWVMKLRDGEKWKLYEAKKSLQASKVHDPELCFVYGKLLQEVYFRLDGAMQAFFRRVKAGETPGFPRVRPRHCFFTLKYPSIYIKVEGNTVILPTGGKGKRNKRFP